MPRLDDVEPILRRVLASHHEVVAAYLFGSVARGTSRADSDVDLGVLLDRVVPGLGGIPVALEDELTRAVGAPVQVVVLNVAPADLVQRVLRDGRIVADRDPAARLRFEVQKRNEYFDLAPMLAYYRRTVLAR